MTDKHVLLFSGGLDSYLAYLVLKDNGVDPWPLYVKVGHSYQTQEYQAALRLMNYHNTPLFISDVLNLGAYEEGNAFIPNRNGFLAMAAALYGNRIWMGIMDGEQSYNDCKQSTFTALSMAISALSGEAVVIDSPFWDLTKTEVIQMLDPSLHPLLTRTFSCHNGGQTNNVHCGKCSACFRRWVSFSLNNIHEEYINTPYKTDIAHEYLKKVKGSDVYGGKRDEEIRQAFRKVGMVL